jgi:hypothetical protein
MMAEATAFEDVASKIANGKTPKWLLIGLNHFSKFIRLEPELTTKEYREIDERMLEAAQYLTKWLPTYYDLEKEFGFECPDCVDTVSNALHELIEILEKDIIEARTGVGRKANIQQRICASVIVEAWRLIHDEVKPRSKLFLDTCIAYWLACGRELTDEINDPDNWRRSVDYVLDEGEGVREVLERYKMSEK